LRKRKFLIGASLALVAVLAITAVAIAVTTRTYRQTFGTGPTGTGVTKPNKPAGTYFTEKSTDLQNTQGNEQSKLDEYVDVKFPSGTAIEGRTAPSCRKTNQQILDKPPIYQDGKLQGDFACKKGTVIGKGTAKVRFPFPGANDATGAITVMNCYSDCKVPPPPAPGVGKSKQIILYVNVTGANPIILRGNIIGKSRKTIHVPIPINCLLGTPPDCKNSQGQSNGDARISQLSLAVRKIVKEITINGEKKKRSFIRTPKTCPPSKVWTFTIIFAGRDGVDQKYDSKASCTNS
jgi:hypothetical protein